LAEITNPLSSGIGDSLQQAFEDGLANLPVTFLEHQISKKLKQQIVRPPKGLARKIAEHILSGSTEPFVFEHAAHRKNIDLSIDDSDIEQMTRAIKQFQEKQLPALISSITEKAAKSTLKTLKARWLDEQKLQEADLSGFRERMQSRWGKPLGQLRMLLTLVREWVGEINAREASKRRNKNRQSRKLLIRMLVRGCQITDEILCLLENGFADGAMARWRTLHEIAVVAAVIQQYGDEISKRYLAHQHVESKRAMDKYLACSPKLGYKHMGTRAQARIQKAYDKVIATYGINFKSDYGWAAFHLKKERPTFAHLEEAAGRAEMRSHYQIGNDNIHAGIKSMYVRLGLIGNYERLLAGRSNAGLTEPGQNAAHTLTQFAVLICSSEPILDDNVIANMLIKFRDEIPKSFARIDVQIQREEQSIRRQTSKPTGN
jgi:hypothetical protein